MDVLTYQKMEMCEETLVFCKCVTENREDWKDKF